MPIEPIVSRWEAFGWSVERLPGHDLSRLLAALAPDRSGTPRAPRLIVADTVKGKGVSFMEGVRSWHSDVITPELYARVVAELHGGAA